MYRLSGFGHLSNGKKIRLSFLVKNLHNTKEELKAKLTQLDFDVGEVFIDDITEEE